MEYGRARLEHRRPRSKNRSWEGLREGTTGAAKNGRMLERRPKTETGGSDQDAGAETEN